MFWALDEEPWVFNSMTHLQPNTHDWKFQAQNYQHCAQCLHQSPDSGRGRSASVSAVQTGGDWTGPRPTGRFSWKRGGVLAVSGPTGRHAFRQYLAFQLIPAFFCVCVDHWKRRPGRRTARKEAAVAENALLRSRRRSCREN